MLFAAKRIHLHARRPAENGFYSAWSYSVSPARPIFSLSIDCQDGWPSEGKHASGGNVYKPVVADMDSQTRGNEHTDAIRFGRVIPGLWRNDCA